MNKFAKDTTITFITRVLTLILGLAGSAIIARSLGPEGKGVYALAVLLPSLIVTFTNLGIGQAGIYYIGRGEYSPREIFGNNVMLSVVLGVLSIIIGLTVVFFFRDPVFSDISRRYLLLTLLLIPLNLFFSYTNMVLLGLQRIKEYNAISIGQTVSFLGFITIALWGLRLGIEGAILAGIVANFLVDLFLFFWVKKFTHGISLRPNRAYIKNSSLYGIKVQLGNILAFLYVRLDMFLIGALMSPLAVGYYSVAVGLAEKLWLIPQSASTILFPKLASEKDETRRKEFTPLVSRTSLFITTLGAFAVFLLSRWVMVFLFSGSYLPAVRPLQILLVGIVAMSGSMALGNDLAARGKPILNAFCNAIAVIVNLGLNIIWIPKLGIEGAAWATTVSYSVALAGRVFFYCRISGNSWKKVLLPQRGDWALYWRTGVALIQWAKQKMLVVMRRGG